MRGKRDSLRVWLEKNLNGNKILGLEWRDAKKKIFRIRWKHASKHGWSSAVDGCVFREWAIYSGKFKPGEKAQEQPKIWKANFRCALNALPDIQEIVEERETRGNDAQKVFEMKPVVSKQNRRNRAGSSFSSRDNSSYQASTPYLKHFQDPNMLQLRKSIWARGSSLVRPWPENPPPLLHVRKECFSSTERQGAFSSHAKTTKDNESILPEHKIIELIDSWSHELKEKHETRFCNSMQPQNPCSYSNGFVEPSMELYQKPTCCQIQASRVPASHYYLTQDASEELSSFEYVSHI